MARNTIPSLLSETTLPVIQSFQKEMNQLFDRFNLGSDWPAFGASEGSMVPAIDVAETEEALEVTAEVPGVSEEDLDVSITGDTLVIKGQKSSGREETEKDYHVGERRYGSFRRQISLGFTPEDGAVDADFSEGVLKLTIKKPPAAQSNVQKIDIKKS